MTPRYLFWWMSSLVFVAGVSTILAHGGVIGAEPGQLVAWFGSCLVCLCFGRWLSTKRMIASAVASATGGDADARAAAVAAPSQVVMIGGPGNHEHVVYDDNRGCFDLDHDHDRGAHVIDHRGAHVIDADDDNHGGRALPPGPDVRAGDGLRVGRDLGAPVARRGGVGTRRTHSDPSEVVI